MEAEYSRLPGSIGYAAAHLGKILTALNLVTALMTVVEPGFFRTSLLDAQTLNGARAPSYSGSSAKEKLFTGEHQAFQTVINLFPTGIFRVIPW
jgi:hypothetical protein